MKYPLFLAAVCLAAIFPLAAAANEAPVANADTAHMPATGPILFDVLANDTDADGDSLTITSVYAVQSGASARVVGNQLEYTPPLTVTALDTVNYSISDGQGGTASSSLRFVNGAPTAKYDYYYVFPGQSAGLLDVLSNDTDPDGDPLTIKSVVNGQASGQNLIYIGPISTSFLYYATYTISDNRTGTSTARAYVQQVRLDGTTHIGPESATVSSTLLRRTGDPVETASYFVEYGAGNDFSKSTPVQTKTLSSQDGQMAVTLTDLAPGTLYSYRFVFTAQGRTVRASGQGGVKTFTTLQRPFGPALWYGSEGHAPERRLFAFESTGGQHTVAQGIGGGQLVHGGDGALYVTDAAAGKIFRAGADGQVSVYAAKLAKPTGLAAGRDGTMYVAVETGTSTSKIVAIGLDGTQRDFTGNLAKVAELAISPNGDLFAAPANAGIGILTRVDPGGNATSFGNVSNVIGSVCVGADGYLLARTSNSAFVRLTPTGSMTYLSSPVTGLLGLAPDNALSLPFTFAGYASTSSGAVRALRSSSTSEAAIAPNALDHLAAPAISTAVALPLQRYSSTAALLRGSFTTPGRKVSTRFAWRADSTGAIQYTPRQEFDPALGARETTAAITGLPPAKAYTFWLEVDEPGQSNGHPAISPPVTFAASKSDSHAVADRFHFALSAAPFPLDVLANDASPANNPLTVVSVTSPAHGSVKIENGKVFYTPFPPGRVSDLPIYTTFGEGDAVAAGGSATGLGSNKIPVITFNQFKGNDSFSYMAVDAFGVTTTATVELVNHAPIVDAAAFAVARGSTLTVADFLADAQDIDGDPLTVAVGAQPLHGQVATSARGFAYTPNSTYLASDEFTLMVTDNAGGATTAKVQIFLPEPVADVTAACGVQVAQMEQGVTYASFGVPAINDTGAVAFTASLRGLTRNNLGVFVARAPQVAGAIGAPLKIALAGEDAPGVAGGKFASFGAPVLSPLGRVTFTARAKAGPRTLSGIWTDAKGALSLVALSGAPAGVAPAANFADFTGLALGPTGAIFTAKLSAPAGRDAGLWVEQADGTLKCILREGDQIKFKAGNRIVTSLAIFGAPTGTAGARRGFDSAGDLVVRVSVAPSGEALLRGGPTGGWTVVAESNTVGRMGLGRISKYASSKPGLLSGTLPLSGPIYFKNGNEIDVWTFPSNPNQPLIRGGIAAVGGLAGGVPGANRIPFAALGDPVGNDFGAVAFSGTVEVAPPVVPEDKNSGLWFAEAGDTPRLLVQEGDRAPGVAGAKFSAFQSLSLPGARGLAFVGRASFPTPRSIPPRPAPAPVTGLWAQDRTGELQLLLRTDAPLPGAGTAALKVREFTVLSAVPVATGGRSANATGGFAARVTYEDQSQAIVTLWLP